VIDLPAARRALPILKAHAFGNDFLFVPDTLVAPADAPGLARALCDRHRGIGADGLALYHPTVDGAAMRLLNADGSRAEVSGNGVRCLAAIAAGQFGTAFDGMPAPRPGDLLVIQTGAGEKRLTLLDVEGTRYTFRADMGVPGEIQELRLDTPGGPVDVIALDMGNPHCVVLGAELTDARLHALGPALTRHPAFEEGTNVELVAIAAPDRLRILIWERGVGPTLSSGTGSCAAAVAAIRFGGARPELFVDAPGGSQRIEWIGDRIYLTGWAEVVLDGSWIR
jgi:diaminopimelate epimerase